MANTEEDLSLPSTQESGHEFVDLESGSQVSHVSGTPPGSPRDEPGDEDVKSDHSVVIAPAANGSDFDDELAESTNDVPVGRSGFEFNARSLFATWPQCPLGATAVRQLISSKFGRSLKSWIIGVERHADGNEHLHCLCLFDRRVHFRSALFLDLSNGDEEHPVVYHPNIRPVKPGTKHLERVWHYCAKGGNILCYRNPMFATSTNFVKKHTDFQKWLDWSARTYELRDCQWPIRLPWKRRDDSTQFAELTYPLPSQKQRHLWIWGPANWGKSLWASQQFSLQRVYLRPDSSDKPFDGYADEEIIIYDDIDMSKVPLSELQSVANIYSYPCQVPGIVRYNCKYWKLQQIRTIIVLANFAPIHFYSSNYAPFEARFNVIDLADFPTYVSLLAEAEGREDQAPSSNLRM